MEVFKKTIKLGFIFPAPEYFNDSDECYGLSTLETKSVFFDLIENFLIFANINIDCYVSFNHESVMPVCDTLMAQIDYRFDCLEGSPTLNDKKEITEMPKAKLYAAFPYVDRWKEWTKGNDEYWEDVFGKCSNSFYIAQKGNCNNIDLFISCDRFVIEHCDFLFAIYNRQTQDIIIKESLQIASQLKKPISYINPTTYDIYWCKKLEYLFEKQ